MSTEISGQNDRVKEATPSSINVEIETRTWNRVSQYMDKSPNELTARIKKLEKEWDIERYLGVNMSTLALSGLVAAVFSKNKNWLILPSVVLAFFLQHSVQGWCPPLPILRKLNIRTRKEIEQEKFALKILRGDFRDVAIEVPLQVEKIKQAVKSI
jgi:DNA-binding Lrp family transcriptional regulator